jgi:hypothetical protein
MLGKGRCNDGLFLFCLDKLDGLVTWRYDAFERS